MYVSRTRTYGYYSGTRVQIYVCVYRQYSAMHNNQREYKTVSIARAYVRGSCSVGAVVPGKKWPETVIIDRIEVQRPLNSSDVTRVETQRTHRLPVDRASPDGEQV